jgi:hypothetical protein
MKTNQITVIFYALAFGIAIGYWAGQENVQAEAKVLTVKAQQ